MTRSSVIGASLVLFAVLAANSAFAKDYERNVRRDSSYRQTVKKNTNWNQHRDRHHDWDHHHHGHHHHHNHHAHWHDVHRHRYPYGGWYQYHNRPPYGPKSYFVPGVPYHSSGLSISIGF